MNKVIRNKQILIDEETCWKFWGHEVPGGDEGLGEKLGFEVNGWRWDWIPGEESKFDHGRGTFVTFSCLR